MKITKIILITASFLMFLNISLGAFGAHALKNIFNEYSLEIYQTAISYSFYNTLGLFAVAFISYLLPNNKKVLYSFYLILFGLLIFSFSLYALAYLLIPILGAITPIGGILMIIGWLLLVYTLIKDLKLESN